MIRYALRPSPWGGWHLRRVPPLRRSSGWARRLLSGAAVAAAVAAACIGLLALGAWMDKM